MDGARIVRLNDGFFGRIKLRSLIFILQFVSDIMTRYSSFSIIGQNCIVRIC